jgi:hypothetical protein
MANPLTQQQQLDAQRAAAAFISQNPNAATFLVQQGLKSQKTVLNLPYWSTVRFRAVRTGAGPYTFTLSAGVRKAFSTYIGGDGAVAGFASGTTMTEADTNLLDSNATRNGESVEIRGISAEIDAQASPTIVKHVFRNTSLSLQVGGDTAPPLGRLSFFPQAGGLHGMGNDVMILPAIAESGFVHGAITNGNPIASNYFPLQVPILWAGANAGADTAFNILCDLKTALVLTTADRAAAAGIQAYTSPADGALGTYLDVTFRLHGTRAGKRSVNV